MEHVFGEGATLRETITAEEEECSKKQRVDVRSREMEEENLETERSQVAFVGTISMDAGARLQFDT